MGRGKGGRGGGVPGMTALEWLELFAGHRIKLVLPGKAYQPRPIGVDRRILAG